MKLTLLVEGIRHPVVLTEDGVTIGRGDAATIRIMANAVSRVHSKFFLIDGMPFVVDLRSLNGTMVNGAQVNAPMPIKQGDLILLGEVPFDRERVLRFARTCPFFVSALPSLISSRLPDGPEMVFVGHGQRPLTLTMLVAGSP